MLIMPANAKEMLIIPANAKKNIICDFKRSVMHHVLMLIKKIFDVQ